MYIVVSATTVYKIRFRITMDKVKWNLKNAKYKRELVENKQWNGRCKFLPVSNYFKILNALNISIKRDHYSPLKNDPIICFRNLLQIK